MKFIYECENEYCKKTWYVDTDIVSEECPYCGCGFVKGSKLPEEVEISKTKLKKLKKVGG